MLSQLNTQKTTLIFFFFADGSSTDRCCAIGRSACPVLSRTRRPLEDLARMQNALQQVHPGVPSPFRTSVQVPTYFQKVLPFVVVFSLQLAESKQKL